jgi:hypothetical protein
VTAVVPLPIDEVVDVRPGARVAETAGASWLLEYAVSRDSVLRELIILAYLGLPTGSPPRYRHSRGTTPEDLSHTARAGLIAAIDRYDPAKGTSFVPFAVACVVGELKRHLRDTSWRLHVPRPLKERALRLYQAAYDLHISSVGDAEDLVVGLGRLVQQVTDQPGTALIHRRLPPSSAVRASSANLRVAQRIRWHFR